MPAETQRRVCALCGILFALLIPPGVEETESDKLCPKCVKLPQPPHSADENHRPALRRRRLTAGIVGTMLAVVGTMLAVAVE